MNNINIPPFSANWHNPIGDNNNLPNSIMQFLIELENLLPPQDAEKLKQALSSGHFDPDAFVKILTEIESFLKNNAAEIEQACLKNGYPLNDPNQPMSILDELDGAFNCITILKNELANHQTPDLNVFAMLQEDLQNLGGMMVNPNS